MTAPDPLALDAAAEVRRIELAIAAQVDRTLRRRGAVVCVSGGVDSAVVAALCARALGPTRVLALLLPERDSSAESLSLGRLVASSLGLEAAAQDITPILEAAGCYAHQAAAIRRVFPDYGEGHRCKLGLPPFAEGDRLAITSLTVESPTGERRTSRLPAAAYRELVAATSWKQRVRATMAYYHADRLGFAVAGTPNKLELDQGFFVKGGDGAADFKPIAHLFKSQVYALAAFLDVPAEVRARPPTTDTFSLEQTQEEFYFRLPYRAMDLCLFGRDRGAPAADVAALAGLSTEVVERAYRDIDAKRRATRYLHLAPLLVEPIDAGEE